LVINDAIKLLQILQRNYLAEGKKNKILATLQGLIFTKGLFKIRPLVINLLECSHTKTGQQCKPTNRHGYTAHQ